MAHLSPPPSPPMHRPAMQRSPFSTGLQPGLNTRGNYLLFLKILTSHKHIKPHLFFQCTLKIDFMYPNQLDLSILYNPLLYSNALFWPPQFFFPYQQGPLQSPQSPPGHNRDYTLTPEKDEIIIGKQTAVTSNTAILSASFHHTDDDMPLNLSTKPSPPSPSPQFRSTANHAAMIWSPASMCEKETAAERTSIRDTHNAIKREQNGLRRYPFMVDRHHHSDYNNRSEEMPSAVCSVGSYDNGHDAATDSDDNNSFSVPPNNGPLLLQHRALSDNNNSAGSTVFSQFSAKAQIGLLNHFHKHRDIHMLRQNRTDIFVVNNNNEFLRDKELPRPDSTAHSDGTTMVKSEPEERKREHRCFAVSLFAFGVYLKCFS